MIDKENPLISNSLWTNSIEQSFVDTDAPLRNYSDIAVIGGGLSGCSTAYHCAKNGLDVCVIEKETIGWGASGRNGGQVNPGLKELPREIIYHFGKDQGERVVKLSGGAPDYVFDLVKENKIHCDAFQGGWIQVSYGKHGNSYNRKLFEQYSEIDAPVEILSSSEVSDLLGSNYYGGGVMDKRGGKVHPLKYVIGLAQAAKKRGARVHQKVSILKVKKLKDGYELFSSAGVFRAKRVILATNGYGSLANGTLNRNVIPVQSVQVATAPLSDNLLKTIIPKGHVVSDTQRLLKYFRIAENGRLLMGGRGGTSDKTINQQLQELRDHVKVMFPALSNINFDYAWGGNIALTLDHFPQIAKLENGIISLSGYNGRGVAMTTVLGKVVADYLSGVEIEELDFPIKKLKAVPLLNLQKKALPLAIWYKKLADRWDI